MNSNGKNQLPDEGIAKSEYSEIYRSLRTRILFNKKDAKVISIVSNDINDGKTDLALSLAESFANAGLKVLLVDGNLRNPTLSLGMALRENDFSKLLEEASDIETTIIGTSIENLFILPTKSAESYSTELLASNYLPDVMSKAREMFDFVVADTLSLNEGMDAFILSAHSDGVIYLTVENKTKERELEKNKIILDEAGIEIIGAVIKRDN